MRKWYVVYSQPMKEKNAQENLESQGYEVYLPRFQKTIRHARKVGRILAPLFPRYLFISLDLAIDRWRSVNGTRGVSNLLMANDKPIPVSVTAVEDLKACENQEGVVPIESLQLFMEGDKVLVTEGAFAGCVGIFERMSDRSRSQILLSFLGREVNVALPAYAIQAA